MTSHGPTGPSPADDLHLAVGSAVDTLGGVPDDAWAAPAGTTEWDCWETVEHVCDDLFSYALQLGPTQPRLDSVVPVAWGRRRPGGPANAIFVERSVGTGGLLEVLESCGALLVAMVRVTAPGVRSHHAYGVSDPSGFAAMGIVETLVHMSDVASGLRLPWHPPGDVCRGALDRLFPQAPSDQDPWQTLLWATGRATLPGRDRLTDWTWDGRPRQEVRAPA